MNRRYTMSQHSTIVALEWLQ